MNQNIKEDVKHILDAHIFYDRDEEETVVNDIAIIEELTTYIQKVREESVVGFWEWYKKGNGFKEDVIYPNYPDLYTHHQEKGCDK